RRDIAGLPRGPPLPSLRTELRPGRSAGRAERAVSHAERVDEEAAREGHEAQGEEVCVAVVDQPGEDEQSDCGDQQDRTEAKLHRFLLFTDTRLVDELD